MQRAVHRARVPQPRRPSRRPRGRPRGPLHFLTDASVTSRLDRSSCGCSTTSTGRRSSSSTPSAPARRPRRVPGPAAPPQPRSTSPPPPRSTSAPPETPRPSTSLPAWRAARRRGQLRVVPSPRGQVGPATRRTRQLAPPPPPGSAHVLHGREVALEVDLGASRSTCSTCRYCVWCALWLCCASMSNDSSHESVRPIL